MTKPRLVHLTTTDMSLDWLLGPQLEEFADAGYEVIAMSAPGPHVPALEAKGITHHPIHSLTRAMSPRADLAAARELYRAFKRLKPAIVHTHNPKPGILGRLAARAAKVDVVVNTVHGLYATPEDRLARRAVVYALERVAATVSDAELYQNREDMALMNRLGVSADRQVLLGNGIDLERFNPATGIAGRKRIRAELGIDDETLVVGAVGRLVWEKGYREFFEVAAALKDQATFVVVGPAEPSKAGAVDQTSIDRAKANGVQFVGQRSDMPDLYRAFDMCVLASYREGFPRSVMEASAMGLPVVATDIRGTRETVNQPDTGTLVPPRDAARLRSALERLIHDPQLRRDQSRNAVVHANANFDVAAVVDITLKVYADVLNRPSQS